MVQPMRTDLLNSEQPPLVYTDLSTTQALQPSSGSDRLLTAIWLILCLLTLGCAILVSSASDSAPVVGVSAVDGNSSIPGPTK